MKRESHGRRKNTRYPATSKKLKEDGHRCLYQTVNKEGQVECGMWRVLRWKSRRREGKKKPWPVFEPTAKKSEKLGDERYPAQGWSDLTTPSCSSWRNIGPNLPYIPPSGWLNGQKKGVLSQTRTCSLEKKKKMGEEGVVSAIRPARSVLTAPNGLPRGLTAQNLVEKGPPRGRQAGRRLFVARCTQHSSSFF